MSGFEENGGPKSSKSESLVDTTGPLTEADAHTLASTYESLEPEVKKTEEAAANGRRELKRIMDRLMRDPNGIKALQKKGIVAKDK